MKIYLVRHGQTNYNSMRLIQGRVDAPLNNIGQKQAKNAGQTLKALKISFDKIVSSPLSRALETATLIARKLNYHDSIALEPLLMERDFGNYELSKIADSFPKIMVEGFKEQYFEDNDLLKSRILQAINNLDKNYHDKTIIATVHAHVIRTFYVIADSKTYTYTNFFLGNGSIHVFDYNNDTLKLEETYNNEE